jgi:ribosomal subunit interface protein
VDILVRGRNVEVPDHFRQHVSEKLQRVERYDHKIIRVDVELYHERNPRQSGSCQRVEITCKSRGPVIRSEACAADFYSALDFSVTKLEGRLRRSADRRRVHHGSRTPTSVAAATSAVIAGEVASREGINGVSAAEGHLSTAVLEGLDSAGNEGPGRVVREKEHPAKPMTIDQALFEMELVGHDFYLFSDADTGQPSVVYRRKGYDYGVIRLTS